MNWFKNRYCWLTLVTVVAAVCLPVWARAQTVTVRASVSEVVALSASPNLAPNVRVQAMGDRRSLTLELTGTGEGVQTFRLPILIRSNSGYSISSLVRSEAVALAELTLLDTRATGRFVAPEATATLRSSTPGGSTRLEPTAPLSILRGSRISLAGTLDSPENAVEVTLLLTVSPGTKANVWRVHLTLFAAPEPGN